VNRLPHQAASMLFPKPYTSTSTFCGHYFKPPLLLFPFRLVPFHTYHVRRTSGWSVETC